VAFIGGFLLFTKKVSLVFWYHTFSPIIKLAFGGSQILQKGCHIYWWLTVFHQKGTH
jgi:hypothetical protein